MSLLAFQVGRKLGHATIPAIRKTKGLWQNLNRARSEATQAEAEFGQALAAELRLKIGVNNDPQTTAMLQGIVTKLASCLRNKDRSFTVEVLRDDAVNAIGLAGGAIFLSSGLVALCGRDPNQLAFVIAHELAHVVRGHALDRVMTRIGTEGFSSIVSRGLLNSTLRTEGLAWLETAYGVEDEADADELSIRMLMAAGYEPSGAVAFLEKLASFRQTTPSPGVYVQSHLPEADRIGRIRPFSRG